MSEPVSFGIVGAGRIGSLHARLLTHAVENARVAMVYDVDRDRAAALAASLGEVGVAQDALEVMSSDVDAVVVCTSTSAHVEYVRAAAAAGKNIFCEKPISLDIRETESIVDAVANAGVHLAVGFNRRFDPSHRAVRERVSAGDVGVPWQILIVSRDPEPPPYDYITESGGLFRDMAIHDFDMARYVIGEEIVEICADASNLVDVEIGRLGDVDTSAVIGRYASGGIVTIINSRKATYGYDQRLEVHGSEGMVQSLNQHQTATVLAGAHGIEQPPLQSFFTERYLDSYRHQWDAFIGLLRGDTTGIATGDDGRAALALADAAARSLSDHTFVLVEKPVTRPDLIRG